MNDIARELWTEHRFQFDISVGWTENILTRLRDSSIRLQHHCHGFTEKQLERKEEDKWSIKEHIGHLIDLEALHTLRLREFASGAKELPAADMTNKRTEDSDHNLRESANLIAEFKSKRDIFIQIYEDLDASIHTLESYHPRLKTMMKPVDMLFFMAEHDDHHIASIVKLRNSL